ncbi:hypothetical protein PTKIN_Ptkin01aG0338800 [Pterospermum kingtungense]
MNSAGVVINGTPEYVRACVEASLKHLDVEYIDLYYQHRVDGKTPIENTMGELKKLVEEGKIKYIGLSEARPDTIRRAHAVHPITAVQMDWCSNPDSDFVDSPVNNKAKIKHKNKIKAILFAALKKKNRIENLI